MAAEIVLGTVDIPKAAPRDREAPIRPVSYLRPVL
jgi:hypothetical protein